MHEEKNRPFFSVIVKDERKREREKEMGGWLECRLLLRDTATSVRGKKAWSDHRSEGRRQGERKGAEEGKKCGVKGTFLITTHHISEGHKSHNTALQSW